MSSENNKTKKFIATTSINPPTEAYEKYARKAGWHLVIAGDRKTPNSTYYSFVKRYGAENVTFLSLQTQHKLFSSYSKLIGENVISRRIFAILYAYGAGADIIALVDDDNIPLPNWGTKLLVGKKNIVLPSYGNSQGLDVVDPMYIGIVPRNRPDYIWHRGYPFELLKQRQNTVLLTEKHRVNKVHVQADMWLGEPDIDAISRVEMKQHSDGIVWDENRFPFHVRGFAPFNSQNTFISREVVSDYILIPGLRRMEDIWAAYYVEALGYNVVFNKPSVFQARNPHSFMRDFEDEYLGYQRTHSLLLGLQHAKGRGDAMEQLLFRTHGFNTREIMIEHRKAIEGFVQK